MEEKVLKTFLYENKLKFSEIEKKIGVRSNKLSYHIKNMVKKGVLTKDGEYYSLSEAFEHLIPYISEKTAVLPVVLIILKNKDEVFLVKRDKRPFKNKLALPAGRIMVGESINDSVKRILKEKYGIKGLLKNISSVSLEHVRSKGRALHSFILILVSAKTSDVIEYKNPIKEKKNIIKSDYNLITKDINKKTIIREYNTKLQE